MALAAGTQLGVYRITAQIGEGGMGQVYRATDTRLKRQIAIKILPASWAADSERMARFQREAEVLASLNHPNIAHVHGLEENGGITALVMELVEGDDLSQRIARGALPVDEALPIARQIAEALAAAHDQGIIHRDLKPANIRVRTDGTVKVLDFGLAKAMEPAGAMSAGVSMSPTITTPAMTQAGTILGTAAYMSPEQAKGHPVDKRSDLWAYGAVLYEMLTGARAFTGENVPDTLAAILRGEPDWSALPADLPTPIVTLLRGCLEKERRARIADIGVATFVLNHGTQALEPVDARVAGLRRAAVPQPPLWRRAAPIAGALGLVALLAAAGAWVLTRSAPPSIVRATLTTSGSTALNPWADERNVAITPDGSRVIYRGNNQLLVRALSEFEPTVLSGLGAPQAIFTSPDGQWIGFFDSVFLLKKVAITGGPPVTVCAIDAVPSGATWGTDGTIIFATNAPAIGLQRVSAAGGEPTVLTRPNRERGERDHLWPEFLPGDKAVLFTITSADGGAENAVAVLDLQSGNSTVLLRGGSHARYVATGHLVYGAAGALHAVPFDLRRLTVVGTPTPVLDGVRMTPLGGVDAAGSASGSIVFVSGRTGGAGQNTVVSVDREGRASPLPGLPLDSYRQVRVSPDGNRLALATLQDIWTYDLVRASSSRLTSDSARDRKPLWTPDGQRIIFASGRTGSEQLFWRPSDGTGRDEQLFARSSDLLEVQAAGWSADAKQLLFIEVTPDHRCAIMQVTIERPSEAHVLVKNESCNWYPTISPDGAWMAYESNMSGQNEIYVERYPELGHRQKISTGGGYLPLWSRNGRELFFSSGDSRHILSVPVQYGTTLVAGRPQVLFEAAMEATLSGRPYDVTPDGRFMIIRRGPEESGGGAPDLKVVLNWFEELRRLVPTR
jgi:serine/threonine-protein kinase